MEKDKKYNIVLGIIIFLFILVVGFAIAWGLGIIGLKDSGEKVANNHNVVENNVDVNEEKIISNIEETVLKEYVEKIYRRHEISIPEFKNINDADERWLWGVIYNNCDKSSIDMGEYTDNSVVYKNQLINKGKELFGDVLTVVPPVEGGNINFFEYNSKYDCYITIGRGGESVIPKYIISEMVRKDDIFTVVIIEYLYDNTDFPMGEDERIYKISLNVGDTKIVTFNSNEEFDVEKYVLDNNDKFVQKKLTIKNNAGKYNLVSSEIIK